MGSTINREQRFAKLNFDAYGNARDWKPVFWITTEESGRIELDTHRMLSRYSVDATYIRTASLKSPASALRVRRSLP